MNTKIRNDKFWNYVPCFVKKNIVLPTLGIEILGYFPYHIARIKSVIDINYIPRKFFHEFEELLILNHINDNKAVYICKPYYPFEYQLGANPFAIMLKDDYVIIGDWNAVVQYDNNSFKLNSIE